MSLTKCQRKRLKFYADKPTDEKSCPATKEYLEWCSRNKELEQQTSDENDYTHMVQTFLEKNKDSSYTSTDPCEDCLYRRLQECGDGGLESIKILLSANKSFPVLLEEGDFYNIQTQKWHFFVGWAALNELKGKGGSFNFHCVELTIWLYETAEAEAAKENDIKAKENLSLFREKVHQLVEGEKDWNDIKKDWKEIKDTFKARNNGNTFYGRIGEIVERLQK